jgi:hypothetical protein
MASGFPFGYPLLSLCEKKIDLRAGSGVTLAGSGRSRNHALRNATQEMGKMKSLIDSMLVYWVILLLISLGVAAVIYLVWLKDLLV